MSGHIPGRSSEVEKGVGSRQAGRLGTSFGKDLPKAVRGREVTADAARAVGKHPQPISPSCSRFALFGLCQPGRVGETESELADAPSAPRTAPQDVH